MGSKENSAAAPSPLRSNSKSQPSLLQAGQGLPKIFPFPEQFKWHVKALGYCLCLLITVHSTSPWQKIGENSLRNPKLTIYPEESGGTEGAKPSSREKRGTGKKPSDTLDLVNQLVHSANMGSEPWQQKTLNFHGLSVPWTTQWCCQCTLSSGREGCLAFLKTWGDFTTRWTNTEDYFRLLIIRISLHTSWFLSNQLEVVE